MEEHSIEHSVEVDFSNELIGGGVLSVGLVQEEIMFPRIITAIKALKMGKSHNHLQFTPPAILRELNKAFIGFNLREERRKRRGGR